MRDTDGGKIYNMKHGWREDRRDETQTEGR